MSLRHYILPENMRTVKSSPPGQNDRHFADDIFKYVFMNEKVLFRFEFHWSLFTRVQLTIFQHWFRWWLGSDQATSHYLNYSLTHIYGIMRRLVKGVKERRSKCYSDVTVGVTASKIAGSWIVIGGSPHSRSVMRKVFPRHVPVITISHKICFCCVCHHDTVYQYNSDIETVICIKSLSWSLIMLQFCIAFSCSVLLFSIESVVSVCSTYNSYSMWNSIRGVHKDF